MERRAYSRETGVQNVKNWTLHRTWEFLRHLEHISWEEFETSLSKPEVQEFFDFFQLDTRNAKALFDFMDEDNSDSVDTQELVDACFRYGGPAKALSLGVMAQSLEHMITKLDSHIDGVDDHMEKMHQTVNQRILNITDQLGVKEDGRRQ